MSGRTGTRSSEPSTPDWLSSPSGQLRVWMVEILKELWSREPLGSTPMDVVNQALMEYGRLVKPS